MTSANTSGDQNEEARAFLQRRIGGAGLAGAAGFGAFLTFRVVADLGAPDGNLLEPSLVWHGVAALALLAMWGACRVRPLSVRALRVVEAAGLLGTTLATVSMGRHLELWSRPEMTVFSALTFGWTARAIYVPSSARRTLWLTAIGGVPMLIAVYTSWLAFNPEQWVLLSPQLGHVTPSDVAHNITQGMVVWWVLTTGLCMAASRVIYGLRREVREARQLGQYTLERKLGEGGMGMVYRASHAMLRRPTAIKLLLPEKIGDANLVRFEREVRMTAQLAHPNTVRIYDYGRTRDGTLYYAMELLDGATLEQVVELDGAQDPARVVYILSQIASALTEAHGAGLIHRDIKPSNIILCEQGGVSDVAKIVDFGLVKDLDDAADGPNLTNPEIVTGTPLYMPPESIADPASVDNRSDLYALGAVAYYLLTGTHVFSGKTSVEVCSQHLHAQPMPPSERLGSPLPDALEKLVLDCLAKDRDERPRDARELLRRLRGIELSETWEQEAAEAWWSAHADELRAIVAEPSTSDQTELDVDFASRAGGARG